MDWLHSPVAGRYDLRSEVAVAVCRVGDDHFHTGILYRHPEKGEVWLLDLAWHCWLRNGPPQANEEYWWVETKLSELDAMMVTEYCLLVADRNGASTIPFGFDENGRLARSGEAEFGPHAHGFTCATFVINVFETLGFQVLQRDSWRKRSADRAWHLKIIRQLAGAQGKCRKLADHLAAIDRDVGRVRYRPTEVVAAWAARTRPTPFNEATCLAALIEGRMDEAAQA